MQFLRRPSPNLGQLEDLERTTLDAAGRLGLDSIPQTSSQARQRTVIVQRGLREIRKSHPIEDQPHSQKLDQAPLRRRMGDAVSPNLSLPDHARPAAQSQQRRGNVALPFFTSNAQQRQ